VAAFVIGAYSMGVHSRSRTATLAVATGAAVVVSVVFGSGIVPVPSALLPFLLLIPAWLIGNAVRIPTLQAEAMRERALRIEREHEAAKAAAVAAERARIARELHDVVAHSVGVMVVQSGAARQVIRQEPEAAQESMLAVEASGRQALTELRRLLDLLGEEQERAELQPQPGVGQLGALVARMTAAGQPVELLVEGAPRPLPPGLDLTVYRVVQEALTNALKYARGARTQVLLRYEDGSLELHVLDDGVPDRPPEAAGTGRGLVGMRQRVAMYGGELQAGLRPQRGYAVRARPPVEPA
jgi:signal transduction histidine kinase